MKRILVAFTIGVALISSAGAAAADELFFKVCENYRSGQFRDCKALDAIEFSPLGSIILHVYSELSWTPDGTRQHPDIFLRWLHRAPDGNETLIAGFPDSTAYRWRPSPATATTRWHIQATVWKDIPGTFVFQAFTDPAALERTKLEEIVLPVLPVRESG